MDKLAPHQLVDRIEEIKAVISVCISSLRDPGASDQQSTAMVLINHAFVPLRDIHSQLSDTTGVDHD